MPNEPSPISPRYRLGLALKGLLLAALALVFAALVLRAAVKPELQLVLRALAVLLFSVPLIFLGWTWSLAFADAVVGQAVRVPSAVALPSRRSGVSFRLPDGRYAEFLLYNPYGPLTPSKAYCLTVGRYSRVLVAPPTPQ